MSLHWHRDCLYMVLMSVQPILFMQSCSDHLLHCCFLVCLPCSNFCWSFLPHWQISGKSLFGYCFYKSFLKLCHMQLKMNYLPLFSCILECCWCLVKIREKLLGLFLVDIIHIISLSSLKIYIFWWCAFLFNCQPDIQIRIFYICHSYQVLLRVSVWH